MKARILMAMTTLSLCIACSTFESPADMAEARYGKVVTAEVVGGEGRGTQRIVVRMNDGSTVDVTQERDSAIMQGDVVRVLGTGKSARVRKL